MMRLYIYGHAVSEGMALSNHTALAGLPMTDSTRVVLTLSPRKKILSPKELNISTRYNILAGRSVSRTNFSTPVRVNHYRLP